MQTASLSLKYKGINTEFHLGQQVFFWRDARQPDLVKVRWLGPAHIVMKEHKNPQEANSPVSVYWLAFKSQLIRCAPHHIRPDIKAVAHSLDDTQEALNKVRQLKSRGVTRYYDLHQLNRRNLMDVEEDEHGESENLHSDSDHEMAPPRQRPRLSMAPPEAPADSPTPDGENQRHLHQHQRHHRVIRLRQTPHRHLPQFRSLQARSHCPNQAKNHQHSRQHPRHTGHHLKEYYQTARHKYHS